IGWYRRSFTYDQTEKIILRFDGVYMDSTLYVNGKYVGEWKYGYSAFEHDITDQLYQGDNEILLKVVYQSPNSRWYTGAGIYRNVWLKTRGKNYIQSDGIYISTKERGTNWAIEIETDLSLTEQVKVKHELFNQDEKIAETIETVLSSQTIEQTLL